MQHREGGAGGSCCISLAVSRGLFLSWGLPRPERRLCNCTSAPIGALPKLRCSTSTGLDYPALAKFVRRRVHRSQTGSLPCRARTVFGRSRPWHTARVDVLALPMGSCGACMSCLVSPRASAWCEPCLGYRSRPNTATEIPPLSVTPCARGNIPHHSLPTSCLPATGDPGPEGGRPQSSVASGDAQPWQTPTSRAVAPLRSRPTPTPRPTPMISRTTSSASLSPATPRCSLRLPPATPCLLTRRAVPAGRRKACPAV